MKVKTILISQPKPKSDKSPYFDLAEKSNVKIEFRSFIQVEGITTKEFRQSKVDILNHTAVIFSSKMAIDHFFAIAEGLRITIPDTMKYFCVTEKVAYYLQKYIVYRKRKIFYGPSTLPNLMDSIIKHKGEKFLLPVSDVHNDSFPALLRESNIDFTKATIYRTVSADLSDLSDVNYDMIVFYSPSGIESLFKNFPDFKQNKTLIAAFGAATAKAVHEAGLELNVEAPVPGAPSMTMALEQFIEKRNKEVKTA